MLLPIPEKAEIVEVEPELPDPIQVSELPELEVPEPEPVPAPVFVPAPQPATPPVTTPPVVVQSPPQIVTPAPASVPAPAPQPSPQPTPQSVETPPPTGEPNTTEPLSKPQKKLDPAALPGSTSVERTYREVGTGQDLTFVNTFIDALTQGVYTENKSGDYTPLSTGTLTLTVPAGDNCFPKAEPIDGTDSVMLPASLFVVVSQGADDGEGLIKTIEIGRSTGYDEANELITSFGLPDEAYDSIYDWLKQQVGGTFPFDTQGPELVFLIFNVEAVFENHSCPS